MTATDPDKQPEGELDPKKADTLSNADTSSVENQQRKLPYPKSVFFIVSNEFCERFSYYGMRTVLTLYLTNILLFSQTDAKVVYHTFSMFVYFFPVVGAIISDSWLGKFKTILYVSIIYACGSVLVAVTAAEPLGIPQREFTILGLFLIAMGTGGIKPCVSAFGGDQFVIPEQAKALAAFFSLFYFSINAGSLLSTFITPVLRNNVHCFGADSCYPLAFGVPGALMIIAIVIFGCGRPLYTVKEPQGNIMVEVGKCIGYATKKRFSKNRQPVDHWLDRSEEKYGQKIVNEVKAVLKVLVLYIPLPIFWALYDQQGSAWTFQAVRMDGYIGFYTILPDQMQVVNPLLILAFIPLFTYGVYPLLAKCNMLKTPLQRMCCGGFLAAVAFVLSAFVALALENTEPKHPSSSDIQLRIYNPSNCVYTINIDSLGINEELLPLQSYTQIDIPFNATSEVPVSYTATGGCPSGSSNFSMSPKTAYGFYINQGGLVQYVDDVAKSATGYPLVRTLTYDPSQQITYTHSTSGSIVSADTTNVTLSAMPYTGIYHINDNTESTIEVELGGTYTVMLNSVTNIEQVTTTNPNSVHMLLLLPQYIVITAAEIMFSITGLEFSYSQAPVSMKSVLTACFLLTTALGNVIIVAIESAEFFELQSNNFFLYTGLMVVDMLIFMWLAIRYTYVELEHTSSQEEVQELKKPKPTRGIDNPAFNNNKVPAE